MPRRSYTLAQTQRDSNAVFDDHGYTETCSIMIGRDVMNMSKRGRTPLDLALLNRSIGFARRWREIDGRGFVGKRRIFRQIKLWEDIRINSILRPIQTINSSVVAGQRRDGRKSWRELMRSRETRTVDRLL
jgi:hypothetical protein